MKPPFAHRIKKPFEYVPASATDIRKTIKRAAEALKTKVAKPAANVRQIRKQKVAA